MSFHRLGIVAVWSSLLISCASAGAPEESPVEETERGVSNLRAAYVAAVQGSAGERFRVSVEEDGLSAVMVPGELDASFRDGGVAIQRTGDSVPTLTLRTKAFGCDGEREPVAAATPRGEGNRVTYDRGSVVEWWLNGPLGVEQGFDVAEAPACAREGAALAVEVELGGASEAQLDPSGTEVLLAGPDGLRMRMTDVYAFDASGSELPARLTLENDVLSIVVDAKEAAYPITIDPVLMTETQVVQASNAPASGYFGNSVAMQGDRAVIAADDYVYVFDYAAGLWTQSALLSTPGFGTSVALDGNTLAVSGFSQVMIFTESAGVWSLQQTVTGGGNGAYPHVYPNVLGLSGDTLAVGAPQLNFVDIFVRAGSVWSKQQTLSVNQGGYPPSFGTAIAVTGNTLIVGSPNEASSIGNAYVYTRSGTVWTQSQVIAPPAGFGGLGKGVAFSAGTLVLGAPYSSPSGAALVYAQSGSTFTYQQALSSPTAYLNIAVGTDVAISGDMVVATSYGGAYYTPSAAYLFYRSAGVWYESVKLQPSVPTGAGNYGQSVAVSGNHVLISRPGDGSYFGYPGKGYFYEIDPALFLGCLSAPDGTVCDDGNSCSTGDVCQGGACVGTTLDNDSDGVPNCTDNCVDDYNPSQLDLNSDYHGDACQTACVNVKRGGSLGAVYDTMVAQAIPNTPSGSNPFLKTGLASGQPVRSLLRFDLSFLPDATVLQTATLDLVVKTGAGSPTVTLHGITAPWVEATATWNNFANAFNPAILTSVTPSVGRRLVDVTGAASGWIGSGAVNNGLLLQQASGATQFGSSEGTPIDTRPQLTVCFTVPGY